MSLLGVNAIPNTGDCAAAFNNPVLNPAFFELMADLEQYIDLVYTLISGTFTSITRPYVAHVFCGLSQEALIAKQKGMVVLVNSHNLVALKAWLQVAVGEAEADRIVNNLKLRIETYLK